MGGLLGRSSANLPSSIRSGVNVLKHTVQATKALQQLSSISLTKRNCWAGPSTSTCSNSTPLNKQSKKNYANPTPFIYKSSSKDSSSHQNRIKDRINNKESTDLKIGDEIETNACLDKGTVHFPFPNQDKFLTDEKQFLPHDEIMELKRQMASVRQDIPVSKVSLEDIHVQINILNV